MSIAGHFEEFVDKYGYYVVIAPLNKYIPSAVGDVNILREQA